MARHRVTKIVDPDDIGATIDGYDNTVLQAPFLASQAAQISRESLRRIARSERGQELRLPATRCGLHTGTCSSGNRCLKGAER
jgi:hypothetical protein